MALGTVYHQYRTLDQTYLFQITDQTTVTLKVYDISRRRLSKNSLEITPSESSALLEKPRAIALLKLFEKEIPLASTSSILTFFQDALSNLGGIIQLLKSQVFEGDKQAESLTCPLTLEAFKEPVIDSCGHTFEKSAIEKHLITNPLCPLSRKPIFAANLVPNRQVQHLVETWQKEDPIPTFSLFKKANETLANRNLETAQVYITEKEYQSALDSYAQAFQFTCKWKDYQSIPLLFQQMHEPLKAQLASLYLIKYQLEADEYNQALQTLENLLHEPGLFPDLIPSLQFLLIYLYARQGDNAKTLPVAISTAQTYEQSEPQKAASLYKYTLQHDPLQWQIYTSLFPLLISSQEQAQCLLMGACHAIEEENYSKAREFCKQAKKALPDSFLDRLVDLRCTNRTSLLAPKIESLVRQYLTGKNYKQVVKHCKYFIATASPSQYQSVCQRLIPMLIQTQAQFFNPEKAFRWAAAFFDELLQEKNYKTAGILAKEIHPLLSRFTASNPIPLYKQLATLYTHQNSPKLQEILKHLGKAYVEQGNLALAENVYHEALKKFPDFEQAIALAEILEKEESKIPRAIRIYYDSASLAILQKRFDQADLVFAKLFRIDPFLQQLQTDEKTYLVTQRHLCQISQQLEQTQNQVLSLSKDLEMVKGEIQKLSANNTPDFSGPLNTAGREKALLKAASDGDTVFARKLIMQETNVNTTNPKGETPLILAAEKGHTAIVQILVDNGANIHAERKESYYAPKPQVGGSSEVAKTGIEIATHKGHNEIVRILVNEGAQLTRTHSLLTGHVVISPPLFEAIRQNNVELILLFVENGLDLFADAYKDTLAGQQVPLLAIALACAIKENCAKSCQCLLSFYNDHGKLDFSKAPLPNSPESKDSKYLQWHTAGKNLLLRAVSEGNLEIFKLLLENKVADLYLQHEQIDHSRRIIHKSQFGQHLGSLALKQGEKGQPIVKFLQEVGFRFQ